MERDEYEEFLQSSFKRYRAILVRTPLNLPRVPFPADWLDVPTKFEILADSGFGKYTYATIATESARALANSINRLRLDVAKLQAWGEVLEGMSKVEKINLRNEFLDNLASSALLAPYSIKQRFYFFTAHLSHQANLIRDPHLWKDDFKTLPEDGGINFNAAQKLAKSWAHWEDLSKRLELVDSDEHRIATDNYRNKFTHRFDPNVEVGITQILIRERIGNAERPRYGMGGRTPLSIPTIAILIYKECEKLSEAFVCFQALVREQLTYLFPPHTP